MPSQPEMERSLFKLIHENKGEENKAAIIQATRQTWPGRVRIVQVVNSQDWSFAPGDVSGAGGNDRVILGRIYMGDRPSAHFLYLRGQDSLIENVPTFAVFNSLNNQTYELRQCCKALAFRFNSDFYKVTPFPGDTVYVKSRKEELIASCDHMAKVKDAASSWVWAANDFINHHLTSSQRSAIGKLPCNTAAEKAMIRKISQVMVVASLSSPRDKSAAKVADSKKGPLWDEFRWSFVKYHLSEEQRGKLNARPMKTEAEKETLRTIIDGMMLFALQKKLGFVKA